MLTTPLPSQRATKVFFDDIFSHYPRAEHPKVMFSLDALAHFGPNSYSEEQCRAAATKYLKKRIALFEHAEVPPVNLYPRVNVRLKYENVELPTGIRVKRSKKCRHTFSPPDHARTTQPADWVTPCSPFESLQLQAIEHTFPYLMVCKSSLAARQGFEPQLTASKAAVLPLDDRAIKDETI